MSTESAVLTEATVLTILTLTAMGLSLAGSVPQIATMARTRSADGQAWEGWAMYVVCGLIMAYVNWAGYHALLLTVSNLTSAAFCAAAMVLAGMLRSRSDRPSAARLALQDMNTMEFEVLHAAVVEADRARRQAA